MNDYAIVSVLRPPGRTRCPLTAARAPVSVVEQLSRANSKAKHALQQRLQEAGMSVRTEWTRDIQAGPRVALGDAIHAVGQRRSISHCLASSKHRKRLKQLPERNQANKATTHVWRHPILVVRDRSFALNTFPHSY